MYKVTWGGQSWYVFYEDWNIGSFALSTPIVELGVSFTTAELQILQHVDQDC